MLRLLPHLHVDLRRHRPEHVGPGKVHDRVDVLRRVGVSGDLVAGDGDGAAAVPARDEAEGEEEEREDDEDSDENSDHDPETEAEDRSVLGELRVHESSVED